MVRLIVIFTASQLSPTLTLCQVCILSNNYLTTIDPVIINCPQLIKIDVHSNQIRTLPDALFFARMPHLIVANFHDNSFTALDNLLKLGHAASLQVMVVVVVFVDFFTRTGF